MDIVGGIVFFSSVGVGGAVSFGVGWYRVVGNVERIGDSGRLVMLAVTSTSTLTSSSSIWTIELFPKYLKRKTRILLPVCRFSFVPWFVVKFWILALFSSRSSAFVLAGRDKFYEDDSLDI